MIKKLNTSEVANVAGGRIRIHLTGGNQVWLTFNYNVEAGTFLDFFKEKTGRDFPAKTIAEVKKEGVIMPWDWVEEFIEWCKCDDCPEIGPLIVEFYGQ